MATCSNNSQGMSFDQFTTDLRKEIENIQAKEFSKGIFIVMLLPNMFFQ